MNDRVLSITLSSVIFMVILLSYDVSYPGRVAGWHYLTCLIAVGCLILIVVWWERYTARINSRYMLDETPRKKKKRRSRR